MNIKNLTNTMLITVATMIVFSGCSILNKPQPGISKNPEVRHVVYESDPNLKKAIVVLAKKIEALESRLSYVDKNGVEQEFQFRRLQRRLSGMEQNSISQRFQFRRLQRRLSRLAKKINADTLAIFRAQEKDSY